MSVRILSKRNYKTAFLWSGLSLIDFDGLLTLLNNDPASYSGSGSVWTNISNTSANATLFNSPTFNSTSGFTFNGTNQAAEITRNVADDFSLCCWFKTSSTAGSTTGNFFDTPALVNAEIGGVTNDFGLAIGNGTLIFGCVNTPGQVRSTGGWNNNAWHFCVATREKTAGTNRIYVDGSLNATATGASTNSLTAPSVIGIARNAANVQYFTGTIGAVLIYNKVLKATQVTAAYDGSRGWFGA